MIRNTPIILTKWSANMALTKDKVTKVPAWVKMHNVPVVAYYGDGLSLIATQVGRPIMLDTFTSEKCADPWGLLGFARALIEVGADKELKQEVIMAIPNEDEQQVNKQEKEVEEDGFTSVSHRRKKGKQHTNTNQKQSDGLKMNKPKVMVWQKTNQIAHKPDKEASDMDDTDMVKLKNNFNVLQNQDNMFNENNVETSGTNKVPSTGCDSDTPSAGPDKEDNWFASRITKTTDNDSDSEDIEELILEDPITKDTGSKSEKGASTPYIEVPNSHVASARWNHSEVDLVLISQDDQVVHTRIWFKADQKEFFCSFVYAYNRYTHRRGLWFNLAVHKHYIRNRPWSLLEDFNAALNLDDKSASSSNFDISMREFKECVKDIEVSDVNYTGLKYTWNQKPQGDDGVLKKIDRIMANLVFYDSFVGTYAIFQPYRISDHAPAILKIPMISNVKPKTFKFLKVVEKLKHLKKPLRKLLYDQVVYVKAYNDALLMEERFLKQKAKIDWLRVEDSNSAYFHKEVKGHVHQNRIDTVMNADGLVVTGDQVPLAFEAHFSSFLGQQGVNQALNFDNLFINTLDSHVASYMICAVSTHEVKEAVFEMGGDPDKLKLINLCFADDLFLFAHGDVDSAEVIMACLDEFNEVSRLVPSLPKSTTYFCNVLNHTKLAILNILPFEEGHLPVTASSVSYWFDAICWASVFILPSCILLDIEKLMRDFLWCQGDMRKGKAKVAWEVVCLLNQEGGLGIRKLDVFNKALMVTHLWKLLSLKESLWVRWIHAYKIRDRNFWNVPIRGNMTWGWHKILQLRPLIWQFTWYKIGMGDVSTWFDHWSSLCPLADIISTRDIHRVGFSLSTTIRVEPHEVVSWSLSDFFLAEFYCGLPHSYIQEKIG
ncbi:RNA-directed DNA polymerase, eukaryota, reverse transcriptase zinc-binding domain protein [Tanacetum coccineum]